MMEMFKSFKNIIADAVPRPPRSSKSETIPPKKETWSTVDEPEEIFIESDYIDIEENTKPPKNGKKKRKNSENGNEQKSKSNNTFFEYKDPENGAITINTQAAGNVMTLVNGRNIQVGPTIIFGSTSMKYSNSNWSEDSEQHIKKCNLVQLLMDAEIEPEHEYIDYVSKNLGKNWYSIFLKLGFTKGAIETMEIDQKNYGVAEARYKLLLKWVEKDERNTLGRLATILWNEGEREVVKELALLYNRGR